MAGESERPAVTRCRNSRSSTTLRANQGEPSRTAPAMPARGAGSVHLGSSMCFHLNWRTGEYGARSRGLALSREQLLGKVLETNFFGDLRVVDVHIGHLRQKLGDFGSLIATVRGVGYRFDDESG